MSRLLPARRRRLGAALVVVVLAGLGYYAWLGLSVRAELHSAEHQAGTLKSALAAGDQARASRSLADFSRSVSASRGHTSSLGWRLLDHLPFVGDDTRAVATVSAVGAEVADQALAPIVHRVDGGLAQQLAPHHGRLDLTAMTRLRPVLDEASRSLDHATAQLGRVNVAGLTGWVRGPFEQLTGQLRTADTGVGAAARATRIAPAMLGAEGPRSYLMLFDNNAEIRSTGGIPGAWAVLHADHGRLTMGRQGSAGEFGEFTRPVLPQSKAERRLYGVQAATYFQDVNFTPDFPRTAALARAMYAKRYGGHVDGVLSMDAVTLGYLLRATGPVTVHGTTLTSGNATGLLLNGVYRRFPTNAGQDAFFRAVAKAVFGKVSAGGAAPAKLIPALAQSVAEGRTYLHSFAPSVQAVLDPTRIAGRVDAASDVHPRVGIYLSDATGSKMSYFLRTHTSVRATSCRGEQQVMAGRADFHMLTPAPGSLTRYITGGGHYGTPSGQQLVLARIYGPAGGALSDFRIGGKRIAAEQTVDQGRPVATLVVQLHGGQTVRADWTMRSGPGQHRAVIVTQSPGIVAAAAVREFPPAC
ncbi:DUF4012 domain-containing protein [Nocardioides terrisoli]|uniref:DUF4012 domain-containing protein n=1 Tax=Nocardioides terrisoli TaxID=3388267 RepID=UPI00287B9798|nr:DUF4012 domain-containing protein [Nocardioides marmorisolisilvae]